MGRLYRCDVTLVNPSIYRLLPLYSTEIYIEYLSERSLAKTTAQTFYFQNEKSVRVRYF